MQVKLNAMKQKEQEKIATEDKQIAEVKALLEKLEKNKKQRELNVKAYDQKVAEIQQELNDWDNQVAQMAKLNEEIDKKHQQAVTEKGKWVGKKADYAKEAKKWKGQASTAKSTYTKYQALAD